MQSSKNWHSFTLQSSTQRPRSSYWPYRNWWAGNPNTNANLHPNPNLKRKQLKREPWSKKSVKNPKIWVIFSDIRFRYLFYFTSHLLKRRRSQLRTGPRIYFYCFLPRCIVEDSPTSLYSQAKPTTGYAHDSTSTKSNHVLKIHFRLIERPEVPNNHNWLRNITGKILQFGNRKFTHFVNTEPANWDI